LFKLSLIDDDKRGPSNYISSPSNLGSTSNITTNPQAMAESLLNSISSKDEKLGSSHTSHITDTSVRFKESKLVISEFIIHDLLLIELFKALLSIMPMDFIKLIVNYSIHDDEIKNKIENTYYMIMNNLKRRYLLNRRDIPPLFDLGPIHNAIVIAIMKGSLLDLNISNRKDSSSSHSNLDIITTKKSKESRLILSKDAENDCLFIRTLQVALENIPKDIINIMDDYIRHDDTINEYYDRIKREPSTVTGAVILDLYDPNFISHLLDLIRDNKEKFPESHQFRNDLVRFLFKYALAMRKKFADNDELFEESVENIKDILMIINQSVSLSLFDDTKLQSMTKFDFSMFDYLIEYEIFDHPRLLKLFVNKIIDNQSNLIMSLDQIEETYCNGNFNNNLFLKLMLIKFASGDLADEQMKERGWITDEYIVSRPESDWLIVKLPHIYSSENQDEIYKIMSLWVHGLSQSTIKFFHDNKLGFLTTIPTQLVRFLRRLEYIGGLPKGVLINDVLRFSIQIENGQVYKWDKDIFQKYLEEERKEFDPSKGLGISQEEYDKYIKMIG